MKKTIALLLALCLLAGLAACGHGTGIPPATDPNAPPSGETAGPGEKNEGDESGSAPGDGTFLTQQELWAKLAGMWFAKNEDGTVEFVSLTQEGGAFFVSTGLYLSDFFVKGATISYQPENGADYAVLCNMEISPLLTESGEIEYQSMLLHFNLARLEGESLLVFKGAYVEEPTAFQFAGTTLEEYDAYYYDNMVDYTAG